MLSVYFSRSLLFGFLTQSSLPNIVYGVEPPTPPAQLQQSLQNDDVFATGDKGRGQFCLLNSQCYSGCCDFGKGLGFGNCGDPGDCWWADVDVANVRLEAAESTNENTCKHELNFGQPTPYKFRIGESWLAKISNIISPDPYGDGDVFYVASKGLGIAIWVVQDGMTHYLDNDVHFSTARGAAATWNVTISQYGRQLSLIDPYYHGVIAKDLTQSRTPLVRADFLDRAAIVQFTRYVEPTWTLDIGSTRTRAMEEFVEKVCKPEDDECALTVFENLRPGNVERFLSCK